MTVLIAISDNGRSLKNWVLLDHRRSLGSSIQYSVLQPISETQSSNFDLRT